MTTKRKQLLAFLESIIGTSTVSHAGTKHVTGSRKFRYPISIRDDNQNVDKVQFLPYNIPDSQFKNAAYRFGSNELEIIKALNAIVSYFEDKYGIDIENGPEVPSFSTDTKPQSKGLRDFKMIQTKTGIKYMINGRAVPEHKAHEILSSLSRESTGKSPNKLL